MSTTACPKCGIALQDGFILDKTRDSRGPSEWVEGKPERSFWVGIKLRGKARFPIASYRCPRCGFLELYALGSGGPPH